MSAIDTHMHINFACNDEHYRNKKIDEYLKNVYNNDIDFFIPSINPKVVFFTCEDDCNNNCDILNNANETVCPVACNKRNRHRVAIKDNGNNELVAYCTVCKKIVYQGKDPFREYNIELMEFCKEMNNSLPNLVLTLSNSTINEEVSFYEKNFKDLFLGYKIHQTTNMRSINSIKGINSNRPILVHCDSHPYDSIEDAIKFAKRYEGNIVLAHSYLLREENICKGLNNIYYDVCPIDNFRNYRDFIMHHQVFDEIDNIYEAALEYLDEDRILFGTDWPFGNVERNLEEIEKANIDDAVKQKILRKNGSRVYHI